MNFFIKSQAYLVISYQFPHTHYYAVEYLDNYRFKPPLYKKRSYLVSHLQKSIRKMKHLKSVKTAKHLIDLDISSLLRRLPIIMFEDVIPHTSLPIIVWLMIAVSKGFLQIKSVMVQWLLGVVYFLSENKEHDKVHKIDSIDQNDINDNMYLKSILLRISYGGMNGDMKMLLGFCNIIPPFDFNALLGNIVFIYNNIIFF